MCSFTTDSYSHFQVLLNGHFARLFHDGLGVTREGAVEEEKVYVFTSQMSFLLANEQCQMTEGKLQH